MSYTGKQVKDIIEKFRININRAMMKSELKKGFNKCKDNKLAFFEYKTRKLFPKNEEGLDAYERDLERKRQM